MGPGPGPGSLPPRQRPPASPGLLAGAAPAPGCLGGPPPTPALSFPWNLHIAGLGRTFLERLAGRLWGPPAKTEGCALLLNQIPQTLRGPAKAGAWEPAAAKAGSRPAPASCPLPPAGQHRWGRGSHHCPDPSCAVAALLPRGATGPPCLWRRLQLEAEALHPSPSILWCLGARWPPFWASVSPSGRPLTPFPQAGAGFEERPGVSRSHVLVSSPGAAWAPTRGHRWGGGEGPRARKRRRGPSATPARPVHSPRRPWPWASATRRRGISHRVGAARFPRKSLPRREFQVCRALKSHPRPVTARPRPRCPLASAGAPGRTPQG